MQLPTAREVWFARLNRRLREGRRGITEPRCSDLAHEILRIEYEAQKSGDAESAERERRRVWGELGEHVGIGPPPPPGSLRPPIGLHR